MDNEWKDKLRERFSDYSAPEPEGLWEGIERGIAGKPRRKMLPVWLLSGAAAAAAVALAVLLPSRKEEPAPESTDRYVHAVAVDDSDTELAEVSEDTVPGAALAEEPGSAPIAAASRRPLLAEAEPVATVPVSDETVPDAVNPSMLDSDRPSRPGRESEKEEMPEQAGHDEVNQAGHDSERPTRSDRESTKEEAGHRRAFSVGAYGNGGQGATEQSTGYGMYNTAAYSFTRGIYNNGGNENNFDGGKVSDGQMYGLVNMLSGNQASTYEARHGAPVRTGVSLAWELLPHLSLVSGLSWTSLQSTFTESAVGMKTVCRQNLGYLGVPLRLEAGFEPMQRLRLYVGAGGMVEKGLLASTKTESYIGDHLEDIVKGHPGTGGLLWSVGVSAGAEYSLSKRIALYVAPGLEHHFDNGAPVESAYTEKPLQWNVDLGVRFRFGE